MNKPRIIFAGTPEFAAVALRALIDAGHDIVAVYSQPDRPAGRGRKLQASAVKQVALQHNLPVEQPINFKQQDALETLAGYQPDLMIVAAYGLLLPKEVLRIPRLGCMNIHASLLPRWRGAAPIQRAILAGDSRTGITIMQMDAGLDTGDMLLKKVTDIQPDDTAASLHDRLSIMGAQAIIETLALLSQDNLQPEEQDDSQSTYAKKLQKSEAWIDWRASDEQIDRQVRALNPWPVAQTAYGDKTIRVYAIDMTGSPAPGHQAGEILAYDSSGIHVACGVGVVAITRCQLPNARPVPVSELINGHPALFQPGESFLPPTDP